VTIPHSQRDPSQAKTLATFRRLGPADQSPWQLTGHDGVDLVALGSVALQGLLKSGTIRGVLGSELRLGERDAEVGKLANRIAADGEPALFVAGASANDRNRTPRIVCVTFRSVVPKGRGLRGLCGDAHRQGHPAERVIAGVLDTIRNRLRGSAAGPLSSWP
jgi:hypothetical protein